MFYQKFQYSYQYNYNISTTSHEFDFTDPKYPKIFQYIRKFTKSDALPTQIHDDFDLADTDHSKGELLNKYFFSVFTKSNCPEPNPDELNSIDNSLDAIHLTVPEVFQALIKLNPSKAGGIDNVTPTILRNCASALAAPLHHLFTTSLNDGTIPTEWKKHKIIPIYKSGDKCQSKIVVPYHSCAMFQKSWRV